jgi:hypothetical protein
MSPPIIWQNRLLIASPRPVPPYLRVVDASAGDQRCEREGFELQLHSASLDLGEVEDVVDQNK